MADAASSRWPQVGLQRNRCLISRMIAHTEDTVHGEHHHPQPRRRAETQASRACGREWPFHGTRKPATSCAALSARRRPRRTSVAPSTRASLRSEASSSSFPSAARCARRPSSAEHPRHGGHRHQLGRGYPRSRRRHISAHLCIMLPTIGANRWRSQRVRRLSGSVCYSHVEGGGFMAKVESLLANSTVSLARPSSLLRYFKNL